jgi:hypothetical protein
MRNGRPAKIRGGGRRVTTRPRSELSDRIPEAMITEHIQPRSRNRRLFPVFTAARPMPMVMPMKYFPSRLTLSRRRRR